jgi:hypothetical protein
MGTGREVIPNRNTSGWRPVGIKFLTDLTGVRQADLIDISAATDIHNTKFDDPANPIAVNGKLDSSIIPAEYVPFVNYLDEIQLARLRLHNGPFLEFVLPPFT